MKLVSFSTPVRILTALIGLALLEVSVDAKTGRQADSSETPAVLARLARDATRKWNLSEAERLLTAALASDAVSLEALIELSRVSRLRLDYGRSLQILDRASRSHPDSPGLLCEYGLLYLAAEEPSRAEEYFNLALSSDPSSETAILGAAEALLLQRNSETSELRIRQYLERNPNSARAHTLLGRVLLETGDKRIAISELQRAIELDAFDTEALYLLAFCRAVERKPDEVRLLARRVLALNPLHSSARRLLSAYLNGRTGYELKENPRALAQYLRCTKLKQKGRLTEALAECEAALRLEPRYYRALLALGDIWLRRRNYAQAAAAATRAIKVDPDGALAHLALSWANRCMYERARIELGAADFSIRFSSKPGPAKRELTRQVFPDYRSLSPGERMVIDRAVEPLAAFLHELVRKRARFHLLSFDQQPNEVRGLKDLAQEMTIDRRYYASIRGVGGRITVAGIETIEQAASGGFNTIAHEFAHQVHTIALPIVTVRRVRELYQRAVANHRVLDFSAAADEYEYFAQGYEAFLSGFKRPSATMTARHTREELKRLDPDLYRLFLEITRSARL
jgi:tetratricopeptide (TPR) repeat protein